MVVQGENLVQRQLYGGMALISLPQRMTDISDFRPVPDHQEAFADGSLDQSVIVEVVEHASVSDEAAGAFFFDDLATANGASCSQLQAVRTLAPSEMPGLPADVAKVLVEGSQTTAKGQQGDQAANVVHTMMCIVRLPQHGSDVLITLNTPSFISPASAAAEHAGAGAKGAHVAAPQLFASILATFSIVEYALFGGS